MHYALVETGYWQIHSVKGQVVTVFVGHSVYFQPSTLPQQG